MRRSTDMCNGALGMNCKVSQVTETKAIAQKPTLTARQKFQAPQSKRRGDEIKKWDTAGRKYCGKEKSGRPRHVHLVRQFHCRAFPCLTGLLSTVRAAYNGQV
ncbi:MAG: hypothetical protein UZ09_BCD002002321 [Bacteroidetes bacterium OLB9]|nr:MAG: hypothetical protein UZ09_BCD002002321 [Bacteroidetes bacterium OLB9]